jgi:hypothetical protein
VLGASASHVPGLGGDVLTPGDELAFSEEGTLNGVVHVAGSPDFAITAPGLYLINVKLVISDGSTTGDIAGLLSIAIDGVQFPGGTVQPPDGASTRFITSIVQLEPGQIVSVLQHSEEADSVEFAASTTAATIKIVKLD